MHISQCLELGLVALGTSTNSLKEEPKVSRFQKRTNVPGGFCIIFWVVPFPGIVTTKIISCLVGDSYKPSFATITGKGGQPKSSLA